MGNHRFRLSDMMPNAWFPKLKVIGRAIRSPANNSHSTGPGGPSTPKLLPTPEPPYLQPRRASYYFSSRQEKAAPGPGSPVHPRASDTLFPVDPPRKSKKKARRKQPRPSHRLVSSVSAGGWSCRATLDSDVWEGETVAELQAAEALDGLTREKLQDHHRDEDDDGVPCFDKLIIAEHYDDCDGVAASWPPSCSWKVVSPARDVVMDVASNGSSAAKFEELDLSPILTKPSKKEPEKPNKLAGGGRNASSKAATMNSHKQGSFRTPASPKETRKGPRSQRRPSTPPTTQGIRMRATSPRLASKMKVRAKRNRKAGAGASPRGCLSESFAVVKSSADPQRDFRDSMMEMIVENNIRESRDLGDLLACYLSLNSNEYHDVIVKVFEQIWFDLTDVRCRDDVHRLGRARWR
ncbi:hypothetical protein Taro_056754 [Colocasia esculenta]|uniref:Transcription repressor n=1 Tax=Colocasia esculenta TaxID=4460 RepID=A0A843XYC6_COLES|nr:hypothetical protein [Colocasia esculenta]